MKWDINELSERDIQDLIEKLRAEVKADEEAEERKISPLLLAA